MMGRLKSKEVEDWRFKRIPYLERVIAGNLGRLNHILRFSKTGNPEFEKIYSTHYVGRKSKEDD
jgi:hypothetical protein